MSSFHQRKQDSTKGCVLKNGTNFDNFISNFSLFLILIKLAMVSLHHGNQSVKQWLLDCMKCR